MITICQTSWVNVSWRRGCHKAWIATLLSGQEHRELTLADANGKPFGKSCGRFLAVGRDEFRECGKQTCLGEAIAVDAVDASFQPGLVQIGERQALLFVVTSLPL